MIKSLINLSEIVTLIMGSCLILMMGLKTTVKGLQRMFLTHFINDVDKHDVSKVLNHVY